MPSHQHQSARPSMETITICSSPHITGSLSPWLLSSPSRHVTSTNHTEWYISQVTLTSFEPLWRRILIMTFHDTLLDQHHHPKPLVALTTHFLVQLAWHRRTDLRTRVLPVGRICLLVHVRSIEGSASRWKRMVSLCVASRVISPNDMPATGMWTLYSLKQRRRRGPVFWRLVKIFYGKLRESIINPELKVLESCITSCRFFSGVLLIVLLSKYGCLHSLLIYYSPATHPLLLSLLNVLVLYRLLIQPKPMTLTTTFAILSIMYSAVDDTPLSLRLLRIIIRPWIVWY